MKTSSCRLLTLATGLLAIGLPAAHAQLLVSGINTPVTINFEATVTNTYGYKTGAGAAGTNPVLSEPTSFERSAGNANRPSALFSEAFAIQTSGIAVGGLSAGARTSFGTNANLDADTTDSFGNIASQRFANGGTSAGQYAPISSGGIGYALGDPALSTARSSYLTLRIQNGTGATVSDWSFTLDQWYLSGDANVKTFTLQWSTDDSTYTTFDTRTTVRTTTDTPSTTNASHWSALENMGGSFSASVANGGYLYIKMDNSLTANFQSSVALLDNIVVTAIPEPSAFGLVLGGLGSLLLFRGRR